MSKQTYAAKLRDPRWQRKRLAILNRANFTCEDCGATDKTLNVHHSLYMREQEPWEAADCTLRAVCEDCHKLRAAVEKEAVRKMRVTFALLSRAEIEDLRMEIAQRFLSRLKIRDGFPGPIELAAIKRGELTAAGLPPLPKHP